MKNPFEHAPASQSQDGSSVEAQEPDLRDQQVISSILVARDIQGMQKLCALHGWTPAQAELFSQYEILRAGIIKEGDRQVAEREEKNPDLSPVERKLGLYIEYIEPQVRDAVLKLQEKGYETYESGFQFGGTQNIGFGKPYFDTPPDLEKVKQKMGDGMVLVVKPTEIVLKFTQFVPLEEIKRIWDDIADALPQLPVHH